MKDFLDEAEWVTVQGNHEESWDQLVQLWKLYNLHLFHLISMLYKPVRAFAYATLATSASNSKT